MKVILFSFLSEKIQITIEAYFDKEERLIIEGYDIGDIVEEAWGDRDYEYSMTLPPASVERLYDILNIRRGSQQELLDELSKQYNGNRCYSTLMSYLTANNIRFESSSWT